MRAIPSLAPLLALCVIGCGDDGPALQATPDMAVPADLTVGPDLAPYPDLVASLGVGLPCPKGNECLPGLLCLGPALDPNLPAAGYCTKSCNADPDCGANAFCGPPFDKAGNFCFLRCGPNDTCTDKGQVCGRHLGGFADLVNKACLPGNPGAKDGSACKDFGDCNRNQACVVNGLDFPGGYCATIGCTLGDNTTCAPGGTPVCLRADNVNVCFAGCGSDADCRVAQGYKCLQPPGAPSKICLVLNPLGENCKAPADCAGGNPWNCIVDVKAPKGYCTVLGCDVKADTGCPSNGHCVPVNGVGVCFKRCNQTPDCASGNTCQPVVLPGGATSVCAPSP